MNFFSRHKKELILGGLMVLLGGGIFFAGASMTGESIRMPSLPSPGQEEKAGDQAAENDKEAGRESAEEEQTEEAAGEKAAEDAQEAVKTAEERTAEDTAEEAEKETSAAAEQEEPKAEDSAEVKAEEEEARKQGETAGETKKKKKKKKKKTEIVQEPYDEEAQARKEKGEFIGQIDAIIAAEDFWGKYPRQIPEGYSEKSGYTYDTWISRNPTAEEPWYEITLCITDHKQDTKIDRRARVDAYSGRVIEDKKV